MKSTTSEYLKVTDKHLDLFRNITKKYKSRTYVEKKDRWKKLSNDQLWDKLVVQVMVIGSSDGYDRYEERPDLQKIIKFTNLLKLNDESVIAKKINFVLREAGIRYASKSLNKCNKTQALVHNFKILKKTKNNLAGILERISVFDGANADLRKVKYLMKIFEYIKSKSARDFLMGMGICTNTIAIDIRIQNIFKRAGLKIPTTALNNQSIYDTVEKEIIKKICKPLGIEPVKFDRILYQNYDSILEE